MALTLEEKKAVVEEVSSRTSEAASAVLANYRGLSVESLTELRQGARSSGVYLKVVQNTLTKRAFKGTEFECLEDYLVGPTIVGLSLDEPGSAARLFKAFSKGNEALKVKALSIGGKAYPKEELDMLATLPTKDQALSMLMSCVQAPVSGLVRTLNEVPTKLVRVLAAVREKKEQDSA